ncbi:MAG TPA: DegV family protein [Solirubrobacteraceae bacterium]|nr:DegV family protein [Solirubrobacteraceae bacterium]
MPAVAIVSDTTHYLPTDLIKANELHQVSLYVHWQHRQDREIDLPDFDAYYEDLRTAEQLPTTSQPSIGDFLEVWRPLLDEGREIVSIHLSAGISGTHQAGMQARDQLSEAGYDPGRVTLIDSATACGGMGLMLLAAAAAARAGGDGAAVAERARAARDNMKMWFCIDTMEFLRRSGRVGAARAWLGSTLQIKPILTLESEITPVERVRTAGRAFERMVEYLQARHDDGADAYCIQHIQAADEAQKLVERGREVFGADPVFVSEVGPVIGTHIGPGMLGVGAVSSKLLD